MRAPWLKQQRYDKYMVVAKQLWDQFTSGNAIQRAQKIREQEAMEEQMKQEELEKRKRELAAARRRWQQ